MFPFFKLSTYIPNLIALFFRYGLVLNQPSVLFYTYYSDLIKGSGCVQRRQWALPRENKSPISLWRSVQSRDAVLPRHFVRQHRLSQLSVSPVSLTRLPLNVQLRATPDKLLAPITCYGEPVNWQCSRQFTLPWDNMYSEEENGSVAGYCKPF